MWLFLAFVLVPIIEIALFIQVGGAIGLWPTLAIVILTAVAGTFLVRTQGLATLAELQRSLQGDGNPTHAIAHGALILAAGLLLLTPGFFTDATGFALLIPPIRAALIRWGAARLAGRIVTVRSGVDARQRPADDGPIETDYVDLTETDDAPRGSSGWTRPR